MKWKRCGRSLKVLLPLLHNLNPPSSIHGPAAEQKPIHGDIEIVIEPVQCIYFGEAIVYLGIEDFQGAQGNFRER